MPVFPHADVHGNGHNHNQHSVTFIITFKTISNDKLGYQFCQVTQLFWLQQKVVQNTIYDTKLWTFLSEALATPRKKANDPHGVAIPRLKTTALVCKRKEN